MGREFIGHPYQSLVDTGVLKIPKGVVYNGKKWMIGGKGK